MKSFLFLTAAAVLLLAAGCSTPPRPELNLACVLTIERLEGNPEGDFLLNAALYEEGRGEVVVAPKFLVREGQPGNVILQQQKFAPQGSFYTNSFGPIPCGSADGLHAIALVNRTAEKGAFEISFFALWQGKWDGDAAVGSLDIPVVKMRLNQPTLLLRRSAGTVVIPVDVESAPSVANARVWSPGFSGWQKFHAGK